MDATILSWSVCFISSRQPPLNQVVTEARQAQVNRTGCGKNSPEQLDAGLWDHPMFDPQTCGAGGCYTPLGPWATSQLATPVRSKMN